MADYALSDHARLGHTILATLPSDQALVMQSGLGAHVAARSRLSLFPWYTQQAYPQWIVLDATHPDIYPFNPDGFASALFQLQLDPGNTIVLAQDGYWVFEVDGVPANYQAVDFEWEPSLKLDGFRLAQIPTGGYYQPISTGVQATGILEVQLYWTALSTMTENYTISVVLKAPDGFILAQHDAWPGQGALGTLDWVPGVAIRDLHYLELPVDALPAGSTLVVVIYSSATGQRLSPSEGAVIWTQP